MPKREDGPISGREDGKDTRRSAAGRPRKDRAPSGQTPSGQTPSGQTPSGRGRGDQAVRGDVPAGHGQDRGARQARQFGNRPRWDPPARSVRAPASATSDGGAAARSAPPGATRSAPPGATKPPASLGGRSDDRRAEIERREYDPRREERRRAARVALPDDVDGSQLPADARRELRSLPKQTAELVAQHLVVAGQLLEENPEQALRHARAARALAGRVGVVREACGLAAYAAARWTEALAELRAARRITGRPEHLAVLADCERALGRPERALAYADDPDVRGLPQDERIELVIVLAGARADLGQHDAAVLTLQDPARRTTDARPWAVRLWYAYADVLLGAGRPEAREWFSRVAQVDVQEATDAADRVLELDGVVFDASEPDSPGPDSPGPDSKDPHSPEPGETPPDEELGAYLRQKYFRPSTPPARS